ncbi:manganese efflux pump MntP family protein [uncultured Brevundimonas sp.]|uniref:manganese efflux pump MntP n=1 Tax=uncultured Brevundimonas sp. TaxID=213418 RepID=UPI0030ED2E78|tara:strand:+ start:12582 stop:13166 length:585 start_codon:yes stop_codon:yes gene_type:complete
MSAITILLLSLSLSADAFAAAIGRGAVHRPTLSAAVRAGLVFGVIEAVTPVIGWALGLAAAGVIQSVDHWIAFGLLCAVGGKMIWEATRQVPPETAAVAEPQRRGRGHLALVATAVGTSLDAAAVGVSLAFLGVNIGIIAVSIGLTTFVLATLGMLIGRVAGARLGPAAELIGGLLLIGMGTRILLEHLGLIAG